MIFFKKEFDYFTVNVSNNIHFHLNKKIHRFVFAEFVKLSNEFENKRENLKWFMYLATYAAAVLFRMLVEKGGEYTKRLSQELRILNFYLEKNTQKVNKQNIRDS